LTYPLIFSEEAESQLKKLDNPTAKRILDKIVEAAENPNHFFERLAGREDYKLRAGDWRVLARILHKEKSVFVISIGHRKNVYE